MVILLSILSVTCCGIGAPLRFLVLVAFLQHLLLVHLHLRLLRPGRLANALERRLAHLPGLRRHHASLGVLQVGIALLLPLRRALGRGSLGVVQHLLVLPRLGLLVAAGEARVAALRRARHVRDARGARGTATGAQAGRIAETARAARERGGGRAARDGEHDASRACAHTR
jgi:hypothetical protein